MQKDGTLCQGLQIQDRIAEVVSSDSNTESWSEVDHIQSVNGINRVDFYKTILLVHGQPIEFIIDTGSPVTIIPPIIDLTEVKKTTKTFVDVNKNPIKFKGEAMVEVKTEKSREILPILITENKNTQPLLDLDWLDKLEIGLQGSKKTNVIRHVTEDERRKRILNEYEDLFKNNHTIKDLTIDIQLKKDVKPIQQKGRPVPIHFQKIVREELEKLIDKGHLEKADRTTENCFVSPAVITIKKDKSVKIALDSQKLNDACIKRKAAMPNMEELTSKIPAKNYQRKWGYLDVQNRSGLCIRTSEIVERSRKTLRILHHWGRIHRTLPVQERLLRLIRHPYGIPRAHRRVAIQNTGLARRHHMRD